MKCPNCGYENPEGATFCNFCGKTTAPTPATLSPQPSSYRARSPPSPAERPRQCVSCGRSIPWGANVCPYCGHDYRVPIYSYPQQETLSSGMRTLLYIISLLIPVAGIILGIIYYVKPDPELKRVGRNCILIAVIVWVSVAILSLAIIAVISIGFGGTSRLASWAISVLTCWPGNL